MKKRLKIVLWFSLMAVGAAHAEMPSETSPMIRATGLFDLRASPWRDYLNIPKQLEEITSCGLRTNDWRNTVEQMYRIELLSAILDSDNTEENKGVMSVYYLGAYNAAASFPRQLHLPEGICAMWRGPGALDRFDKAYRNVRGRAHPRARRT
jgi:hypothetical protein